MTHILLVCTGNTCRSPLAEAMLRKKLAERGVDGVEVSSAGTGAWDGAPASEGAYLVALEHGLDLSAHRARLLTRELVTTADIVLTMARHHRARVEQLGTGIQAHLLGEYAGRSGADAEVRDPFGGDLEGYRETLVELDAMLGGVVERLERERLGDRR
ncbi:MAG: low molecular weight protein arginine phosphatase [Gemmatimonadales bacterium]